MKTPILFMVLFTASTLSVCLFFAEIRAQKKHASTKPTDVHSWKQIGNYKGQAVRVRDVMKLENSIVFDVRRGRTEANLGIFCAEKTIGYIGETDNGPKLDEKLAFGIPKKGTFGRWLVTRVCAEADRLDVLDLENSKPKPDLVAVDEYINKVLDEWTPIEQAKLATYYFNPTKARRYGDMAEFWIKVVPKDKQAFMKDFYENFLKVPFPADYKSESISHFLDKYLANCESRRMSRVKEVAYLTDGKDSGGFDMSDREVTLQDIVPDSIGEVFWKKGCSVRTTNK